MESPTIRLETSVHVLLVRKQANEWTGMWVMHKDEFVHAPGRTKKRWLVLDGGCQEFNADELELVDEP